MHVSLKLFEQHLLLATCGARSVVGGVVADAAGWE
jgi:hypothetical protein